jgi:hypothetical protein
MTRRVSSSNLIMRGVLLVVVMLLSVSSCGKPKTIPLFPKAPKYAPPSDEENRYAGIKYRQTAGESIAPVVVNDNPAPVAAPTAGPAKPAGEATMNGHPNGITRETVNRSIQTAMGALATCFTNVTQDPMVAVSFEAEPSGRPSLVRVNGAPPDAEKCIRSVMQSVRFPAFEGNGMKVDFPLSFHRVAQPTQAANPAEQRGGQENPPPLFLEP